MNYNEYYSSRESGDLSRKNLHDKISSFNSKKGVPINILLKAAISGLFVALILWLSQTRLGFLAGLLLFFPVISVPAFYFIGASSGMSQVRESVIWSLATIPVWVLFALTLYWASYRFKIVPCILLSIFAWLVGASVLIFIKLVVMKRFFS